MARHVITIPYGPGGPWAHLGSGEIIWDDELGTVEGDHYRVGSILQWIHEQGIPLNASGDGRILILNDPLHDPRDFWWLLPPEMRREPLLSTLPPILRDVEPTPAGRSPPPRTREDGEWRDMIEGSEFVW